MCSSDLVGLLLALAPWNPSAFAQGKVSDALLDRLKNREATQQLETRLMDSIGRRARLQELKASLLKEDGMSPDAILAALKSDPEALKRLNACHHFGITTRAMVFGIADGNLKASLDEGTLSIIPASVDKLYSEYAGRCERLSRPAGGAR